MWMIPGRAWVGTDVLAEPSSPGRAWVGAGVFAEPVFGAMIGKDANRRRHKETNASVTILSVYGFYIAMMAFLQMTLEKRCIHRSPWGGGLADRQVKHRQVEDNRYDRAPVCVCGF